MQTRHRRRFFVHKRLHAQADAVYPARDQRLDDWIGQRTRRTLHRDLRFGKNLEFLPYRKEKLLQLFRRQQARRSAAHINGINRLRYLCALLRRIRAKRSHILTDPLHVAPHLPRGKHARSKVAISAL